MILLNKIVSDETIAHFQSTFISAYSHLLGALGFLLLWLAPIHYAIAGIMVSVFVDTVLGRWAARKTAQRLGKVVREEVTSKKTRLGFTQKAITYIGSIILTFFLDSLILHDLVSYFFPTLSIQYASTKLLAFIFVYIEMDSMDEKIYNIFGYSPKERVTEKIKSFRKSIVKTKQVVDDVKNTRDEFLN